MNVIRAARRVRVTGDGTGVASHAGALLIAELADRSRSQHEAVGGDGAHEAASLGA
jgi:hypothetical protein